jgi:predicted AAA+ superfamily ATPase
MIGRLLEETIRSTLFQGKAIIVTGPRQTGKATLVRNILDSNDADALYLNADEPDVINQLQGASSTFLTQLTFQ